MTDHKNHFRRAEIDIKEVGELQDEFELEYAMSQIICSRSYKKKILALANPDLHKLASKL